MNWQGWKVSALWVGVMLTASHMASAQNQPSKSDLQQMGLGGMTIMSDDEGLAVRGMGFSGGGSSAMASGNSFATIDLGPLGGAHSENSYNSKGKNKAGGDNFSFAGVSISETSGKGGDGSGKMPKGGNGGYGSGPPMGGNNPPPNHGDMGSGGYGGMGGTKTTTVTFTVFAGGFSHAYAH